MNADFRFENHFSLFLVQPMTAAAREHLEENVQAGAMWFNGALVVEPRYVEDLALGLEEAGFSTGRVPMPEAQ